MGWSIVVLSWAASGAAARTGSRMTGSRLIDPRA
jgi:hypothetical protein